MKHNENQERAENPQAPELTNFEQLLLQTHLDKERINHWEKVIELADKKKANKVRAMQLLQWGSGIAVVFLLLMLLRKEIFPDHTPKSQATFAALIDYPFMDNQVRGAGETTASDEVWKQCVSLYQKGKYTEALESSKAIKTPFFTGMCLLQLKQFEAAEKQFIISPNDPDFQPEILYYKAYALQQLGRKDEAKALLTQALARSDLRELWKNAAEKMLRSL